MLGRPSAWCVTALKIGKYRTEVQSRWRRGCFKMEWVFLFKGRAKNTIQTDPRSPVWMDVLSACMLVLVCTPRWVSVVPLAGGMQEDLKETLMECEGLNDIMWGVKDWEKLKLPWFYISFTWNWIDSLYSHNVQGVHMWKSLCVCPQDRSSHISLVPSSVKVVQPWGQCSCYWWSLVKVTRYISHELNTLLWH